MNTLDVVQRPAAVAGRFYPGTAERLARAVDHLLQQAAVSSLRLVSAVIAPHAGYACSGGVAATAFRALGTSARSEGDRIVYLMGPAHWHAVHGVGLSSAGAFVTPLGTASVAGERVAQLLAAGSAYHLADEAHAPEHCLEVELPFLQTVLGDFRIVPMLFDDEAEPQHVAAELARLLDGRPQDLVVVSSDLSHYRAYQDAVNVDAAFLKAVAQGDMAAANVGEACGLVPILTLMALADRLDWQPHLLAYANSGDTCGPRSEVVGYGAVAYTAES